MPICYCMENVVVADPPFEPSVQLTRAVAVPARVFDRILQVHDTLPLPSAVSATCSAAVVDTRPEGSLTRIEQVAPADVLAPIVAEPPIDAGDVDSGSRDPHAHPSRAPVEFVRLGDRRGNRPAPLRRSRCPIRRSGWRLRDVPQRPAPAQACPRAPQRVPAAALRWLPIPRESDRSFCAPTHRSRSATPIAWPMPVP